MTKDEIKAYAQELIDLAQGDPAKGDQRLDASQRMIIVQQTVAICGMPFEGPKDRAEAINAGAGPLRITRGTH